MNHDQFWQLVDTSRGLPERAEALAKLLEQLDPDEIVRFRIIYDDVIHSANKVDLWGAAHTINGGCSDDGASSRFHLLEIASHGYLVIASGRILSGPGAPPREPRPAAQAPAAAPAAPQGERQLPPPRTKVPKLGL